MNFIKLFFFASLFLFFASCNDDDATTPSGEGVIGKWDVTAINYTGTSTTATGGQSFTANFTGTGVNMDLEIEFEENPMNYSTNGDYGIDLETEFMGQIINSSVNNQGFIDGGTWTQVGNNLVIVNGNGDEQTAEILSIDNSIMIIGYQSTMIQNENGAVVTFNIDGTYTFEKQ